jgi:hypothetical protein
MAMQEQRPQPQGRRIPWVRLTILIIAVFLIGYGTITSISGILGTAQGSWYAILSIILGALGVLVTLSGWLLPLPPLFSSPKALTQTPKHPIAFIASEHEYEIFRDEVEATLQSEDYGALVIYANKVLVGEEVRANVRFPSYMNHYRAFSSREDPDSHGTFIAERRINRRPIYVAVFPKLRQETYFVARLLVSARISTFFSRLTPLAPKYRVTLMILPKQVSEIDWR